MRDALSVEAWDHTAAMLAKIHNVNCAKRNDMISDPSELNPYRRLGKSRPQTEAQAQAETDAGIAELKASWIKPKEGVKWPQAPAPSEQAKPTSSCSPRTTVS